LVNGYFIHLLKKKNTFQAIS